MRKLVELETHFPRTGEATAQLVAWNGLRGGLTIEKRAFAEGQSEAYDFLKGVAPEVGISYILVNALGVWEFYDENRNGDGFNLFPYRVGVRATCGHAECAASLDGWVSEPETLLHHYKSFEQHGGIYRHHVNKDPSKSRGSIRHAFLNRRMNRVELLLRYVDQRDPEIPQRMAAGDFPAVSMGCHVRWDVCTICGHRAPTRAQYCKHALTQMRQVLPDGRKVCVLNPSPRFFDISFVFKPADPTGWTFQKVAREQVRLSSELGAHLEAHDAVRQRFEKVSREVHDAWADPSSMVGQYLRWLEPASKVAAPDVAFLLDPTHHVSQEDAIKVASESYRVKVSGDMRDRMIEATPALLGVLGRYPDTFKQATFGPVGDVLRDRAFAPWTDEQVTMGPGAHYRAGAPPRADLLTLTDPYTGHMYQTTRGAAQDADTRDAKQRVLSTALLSGLYVAGLHRLLGRRADHTVATLPLALGLGVATEKGLRNVFTPYRNPTYVTDQGVPVSGGTEFKQASLRPSQWVAKLAQEEARDARLARIERNGGLKFLKWASLPLPTQVDTLVKAAEHVDDEVPTVDLDQLAANLVTLLTT